MSKLRISGYEVEFRKARDESEERDLTLRRVDQFTEVFILIGHFRKVEDCDRIYVKIEIDGGAKAKTQGKWLDYPTGKEKDELFFTGNVQIAPESNYVDVKIVSDNESELALRLILDSH